MTLNLLKLCVGADSVEDLADWQAARMAERKAEQGADARPVHVTRMFPKRGDAVLAGGSLYWVIRGLVLVRQRIVALEPVTGADGIARCALRLDPDLIRTSPQPRRPFQGWRYLKPEEAPADLGTGAGTADLPPALARDLAALGVI